MLAQILDAVPEGGHPAALEGKYMWQTSTATKSDLIDNKGILRDVLLSVVITAKQVYKLGGRC